jgi:hypothetical protein
MEFTEMLNYILYIVLTIILPVVARYVVAFIKAKIKESNIIMDATHNEDLSKIVESALSDVMDAVLYINQIYVDSLKSSGKFDKEAQEEAFNRAYVEAMNMISDEAKKVIEGLYGSFDKWLRIKIESSVNMAKK